MMQRYPFVNIFIHSFEMGGMELACMSIHSASAVWEAHLFKLRSYFKRISNSDKPVRWYDINCLANLNECCANCRFFQAHVDFQRSVAVWELPSFYRAIAMHFWTVVGISLLGVLLLSARAWSVHTGPCLPAFLKGGPLLAPSCFHYIVAPPVCVCGPGLEMALCTGGVIWHCKARLFGPCFNAYVVLSHSYC